MTFHTTRHWMVDVNRTQQFREPKRKSFYDLRLDVITWTGS